MIGAFAEQVRQRAYEMWMADGCVDGRAHDHWVAAERTLLAEAPSPAKRRATPKRAAKSPTTKPAAQSGAAKPAPRAKTAAKAAPRAAARISPEAGGASA